jgi:hypothetical protein
MRVRRDGNQRRKRTRDIKRNMSLSETMTLHSKTKVPELIKRSRFNRSGAQIRAKIFPLLILIFFLSPTASASASNHYTERQLDALAARVGKTFWLSAGDGRAPVFLTSPTAAASTFRPASGDSFLITELTGRSNKNPFYAVQFESGKVGYIGPEAFHEALNVTILSSDPRAGEKEKAEKQATAEKDRVAWINSQPWSAAVKEAAIKKQPTPGLKTTEVKRILGTPLRITKLRGPSKVAEEHWVYPGGSVLIFHNGLLSKVDHVEKQ